MTYSCLVLCSHSVGKMLEVHNRRLAAKQGRVGGESIAFFSVVGKSMLGALMYHVCLPSAH